MKRVMVNGVPVRQGDPATEFRDGLEVAMHMNVVSFRGGEAERA